MGIAEGLGVGACPLNDLLSSPIGEGDPDPAAAQIHPKRKGSASRGGHCAGCGSGGDAAGGGLFEGGGDGLHVLPGQVEVAAAEVAVGSHILVEATAALLGQLA